MPAFMKANLLIKRIYEGPSEKDGKRILVDRLWPRGISKQNAQLDYWLKEVAPSQELRKWFGHKEERFSEFKKRYLAELKDNNSEDLQTLKTLVKSGASITLLYGAKDEAMNQAVVLREFLTGRHPR